ncbi:hypothetical protein QD47_09370 [Paenibacillus terrae]|uniref:Gfo/Idh/MocA-like oxidoreductase N-terminal domain-containing protein n=1 Tax=Paenibacillus terrae TaxID=159743 RepID=A0A0D7X3Q1_9BACL|nr:hypothetical protein QD47_09370 [Paenibacillus terrae]
MLSLQKKYGISQIYSDYNKMFENDDVDTIYIGLPSHLHYSCVCIGSKDSTAPNAVNIQGNKGYIHMASSANVIECLDYVLNKETPIRVDLKEHPHRMYDEFVEFDRII